MTLSNDIADINWLTGDDAGAILAELAEDRAPLHTATARLRKFLSPERTHLVLEQAELRRRAAAKFTQPDKMFFTRRGLEQATDDWTAAYKADRLRRAESWRTRSDSAIADLCSGIGGDLRAIARHDCAIGFDRDPICAHFAAINAGIEVQTADVATLNIADYPAWHIDPDRRPKDKRTTSLDFCEPSLPLIDELLTRGPHAAIKLAPATTPPDHWRNECEFEWISRDGECKQLVAWHGDLATAPGEHRATIITASRGTSTIRGKWSAPEYQVRTLTGSPTRTTPIGQKLQQYLYDVDPAILAAKLTSTLATEHNLSALAPGPTYLTGNTAINDAACTCFEVLDALPLRTRTLADYLRERTIGRLEIKKRGVEIDPDKLRRDLKLRGDNEATILITKIAGKPTTIVARRVFPT